MSKLNLVVITEQEAQALNHILTRESKESLGQYTHERNVIASLWLDEIVLTDKRYVHEFAKLPDALKFMRIYDLRRKYGDYYRPSFDNSDYVIIAQQWHEKLRKADRLDSKLRLCLTRKPTSRYELRCRELVDEVCGGAYLSDGWRDIWYPSIKDVCNLADLLLNEIMSNAEVPCYVFTLRKQCSVINRTLRKIESLVEKE